MATKQKPSSTEILAKLDKLEKQYANTTYLNYKQASELLEKKYSVIAQYVNAGIAHAIQQGNQKLLLLADVYLIEACMHATKYYGCSYVACRIFAELLKESGVAPQQYLTYLKKLEEKAKLTPKEVEKHVNSYQNRGIFQKAKARQSKENI